MASKALYLLVQIWTPSSLVPSSLSLWTSFIPLFPGLFFFFFFLCLEFLLISTFILLFKNLTYSLKPWFHFLPWSDDLCFPMRILTPWNLGNTLPVMLCMACLFKNSFLYILLHWRSDPHLAHLCVLSLRLEEFELHSVSVNICWVKPQRK